MKYIRYQKPIFGLGLIVAVLGFFIGQYFPAVQAATLTTAYDRLSRVQAGLTSGVDHTIVFTTVGAVSGATDSVLVLQFPDADDGKWCATAGTDLTVATSTESSATGLPGTTLSGKCTQGSGASSYDKIYVCAVTSNTWSATTKYGVSVKDGSTGKLGTNAAATDNIQVSLTTGTAASCTDPSAVDTGTIALSTITADQVAVTASINPGLTFSVSNTTLAFGTIGTSNVRFANTASGVDTTFSGTTTSVSATTNAPNGVIISARSKGSSTGAEGNGSPGLYKSSSPTKLIAPTGPSSVAGGTESYALYATNTSGLTVPAGFASNGTTAITTSGQTIFSTTGVVSSGSGTVTLEAGASGITPAGSYADTITLTATGQF